MTLAMFLNSYPGRCHTEVSRGERCEPCDKPAVAVARDYDSYDDVLRWYPVCAYHTRPRDAVLLVDLIGALKAEETGNPCTWCDCPVERCDNYGPGSKCCPDCRHQPVPA